MKRIIVITSLLLVYSLSIFSQRPNKSGGGTQKEGQGTILGFIKEADTKKPVEYANIVLYRVKDSSMVNGTVTDTKGFFKIEKVPFGRFYIKVQFVGFAPKYYNNIAVKPDNLEQNLGIIPLEFSSKQLSTFNVVDNKENVEFNLDKKVVNVDQNAAISGGTAVDVMQTIPSVSVDIDGNVSMRGSTNVTILIDGRPSAFTSLDQIPASMIQRVEIITNPSAKYDPDGMTGIINIIMKKKKEHGYNGMVSVNAGTGDKYNASINMNYRYNKLNFFTAYDNRFFSMKTTSKNLQEYTSYDTLDLNTTFDSINKTIRYVDQYTEGKRKGYFHNFKAGFDYFINDFNTISLSGVYNIREFKHENQTFENNRISDFKYLDRNSKNTNGDNGYELSLNYKKTFEQKGREFSFDGFYSTSDKENSSETYRNNYFLTKSFINTDSLITIKTQQKEPTNDNNLHYSFQTDYIHPLLKTMRIESGLKFVNSISNNNYEFDNYNYITSTYENDTLRSNDFKMDVRFYSAYLIFAQSLGNFKYQGGLRVEQVDLDLSQKSTTQNKKFDRSYFNYFPSGYIKYEFSDEHSVQASYSKRMNRPRGRMLNPFENRSDETNITFGNPNLNPEFVNSYELGHSIVFKKNNFNTTLFYRQTDDIISGKTWQTDSITDYGAPIRNTTYFNLEKSTSYGLELIYSRSLFKIWKINANVSFFSMDLKGSDVDKLIPENNFSWTAKVNSSVNLMKKLDIQAIFNYRSKVKTAGNSHWAADGYGIIGESYALDLGMKYEVLKGNGTISLRLSDVLKSQNMIRDIYSTNYYAYSNWQRESRILFVGFSYKINGGIKQKKRKQAEMDDNNDFEG